ncbi:MAG: hypothetical protein WDN44_04785 [Sphingomonas sp.]
MFVGTQRTPVEGLHADFVDVGSIRAISGQVFRVNIAAAYESPQFHGAVLAKVQARIDCHLRTLTREDIAAYYRNGGLEGRFPILEEEQKAQSLSAGDFDANVGRFVCQGKMEGDRIVSEDEFFSVLH